MQESIKKIPVILLILLAVFSGGFLLGRKGQKEVEIEVIKTKVDTLYRTDTILVEKPKIVERRVVDTMVVEALDYIVVHDTAYVNLPREEVEYRDSSYRAVVSGFLPRLEEMEIYRQDRIVTIQTERVIKPSPWALSIQGGYGVSAKGLTPYIGVGVSYNLYTFKRR